MGGRKLSFSFVPGLVLLRPCWLKVDVMPSEFGHASQRAFLMFAARVEIGSAV
eukprot:SAG22_NODE_59_length_23617_cov_252.868144_7_plen_53_part_00